MRLYSVAVASLTIRAATKWTDNLLSQYEIPEVIHQDRGRARGLSWNALVRIGLIRVLSEDLGCGVRESVALAAGLLEGTGSVEVVAFLGIHFNRSALEAMLRARLADVLEPAPRPRRGRPPKRAGSGG